MLVLSRREQERVIITTASGERIEVLVQEIRRDSVRLGFQADLSVAIHREEVQRGIDERSSE